MPDNNEMVWWTESLGRIELQIKRVDAHTGHHSGRCDDDIAELVEVPYIKEQLDKLDLKLVTACLREAGFDECIEEDDEDNRGRLLWLACGDITDGHCDPQEDE